MKKRLAILLCILLSAAASAADGGGWYDHLDYGLEWGYTATFWEVYHYNYTTPAGPRMDSRDSHFSYKWMSWHCIDYIIMFRIAF